MTHICVTRPQWVNSLLNMCFTCNRHAIKLYSPHYCQLCAPSKSRWRSVPWRVCVFNLLTLQKVWHFIVQCLFIHCSISGWPLRKRCAQCLCKGLPTTKNILSCTLCGIVSCLYFFLPNEQFSSSSSSYNMQAMAMASHLTRTSLQANCGGRKVWTTLPFNVVIIW